MLNFSFLSCPENNPTLSTDEYSSIPYKSESKFENDLDDFKLGNKLEDSSSNHKSRLSDEFCETFCLQRLSSDTTNEEQKTEPKRKSSSILKVLKRRKFSDFNIVEL